MVNLTNKKIAIITTDYFEESELMEPLIQLQDMGAEVVIAAPHGGTIQALRHVEMGRRVDVTTTIDQLDPSAYDAVILPGGVVNADHLRIEEDAKEFVKKIAAAHKPVAAICHGPWLLVSAGLVEGRTLTSYHTLADDIKNAGGKWVDQEVAIDGNFITSRNPGDIPAFINAIANALA